MLRITSMAIAVLGLALALPLSATAADTKSEKAPEAAVAAAGEDAVVLPAPAPKEQTKARRSERRAPHGSRQSEAGFRFQNPYAFPIQTLPIAMPTVTTYSF
jgi:hypothetical protein